MTNEEKVEKYKHIQEMKSQLKANPSVTSKKTIQKLQQELDGLSS